MVARLLFKNPTSTAAESPVLLPPLAVSLEKFAATFDEIDR